MTNSVDDGAAARPRAITPSCTSAFEFVADLFPGVDDLSSVRRVELDSDLMAVSVAKG
jgi:hypothetical protein